MESGALAGRRNRHGRRRCVGARVVALVLLALAVPSRLEALTLDERLALARAFAPVFVFHPAEEFFPISPFYGLGDCDRGPCDGNRLLNPADRSTPRASADRIRAYEAQSIETRLASAVVYFRVFDADHWLRPGQVRVEYWFYYPANRYAIRGGVVPITGDGNHPHDLEHVFLVLDPTRGDAREPQDFVLSEVWASAHAGSSIPSNHYSWKSGGAGGRLTLLVERGSHAMAPDVNHDGRFVVGDDTPGDRPFVWGVRDRGQSWAWFRRGYADSRGTAEAPRLCPPDDERRCAPARHRAAYRMEPAEAIEPTSTAMTRLIDEARAMHARKHWLVRLFGEVDSRTLLSPGLHPDGRDARQIADRPARAERGVAVGFTPLLSPATFFVSGRYAAAFGPGYAPKVMVNLTTLVVPGRSVGEVDASLWYPLDPITKVLFGARARTDFFTWEPTRRSLHAGVEFRVGRWRWRVLARNGEGRSRAEFKMYYFVWQ